MVAVISRGLHLPDSFTCTNTLTAESFTWAEPLVELVELVELFKTPLDSKTR